MFVNLKMCYNIGNSGLIEEQPNNLVYSQYTDSKLAKTKFYLNIPWIRNADYQLMKKPDLK